MFVGNWLSESFTVWVTGTQNETRGLFALAHGLPIQSRLQYGRRSRCLDTSRQDLAVPRIGSVEFLVGGVVRAKRGSVENDARKYASGSGDVMGGEKNRIHLISKAGVEAPLIEEWPEMTKGEVGQQLAARIARALKGAA